MKEHPWEKAGLGKSPYTYLGMTVESGPYRIVGKDGVEMMVGAPGQPMGCCDYCGQGIKYCHKVRSADGKTFVVGGDCVRRVHDKGHPMITQTERKEREERNKKARARFAQKAKESKAELDELLASPELVTKLSALPSDNEWRAKQGDTALDQVKYRARWSGHTGRTELLKMLKDPERMAKYVARCEAMKEAIGNE